MPACIRCKKVQASLNVGNLCKLCFHNDSKAKGNSQTKDIDLDKCVADLTVKELLSIIRAEIEPLGIRLRHLEETLEKDIAEIQSDIQVLKGDLIRVESLETEVNDLKQSTSTQQKTIRHQQTFLEYLANKDRSRNLIITGLPETDEDEQNINSIFQNVVPNIQPIDYNYRRLGNTDTARLPRPILVELINNSANKRKIIFENSKILKANETLKNIFIKKDTHPIFRKEHSRLSNLVWEEKKKPSNVGCNIIYDRKEGVVKNDGVIIDKFVINV